MYFKAILNKSSRKLYFIFKRQKIQVFMLMIKENFSLYSHQHLFDILPVIILVSIYIMYNKDNSLFELL